MYVYIYIYVYGNIYLPQPAETCFRDFNIKGEKKKKKKGRKEERGKRKEKKILNF